MPTVIFAEARDGVGSSKLFLVRFCCHVSAQRGQRSHGGRGFSLTERSLLQNNADNI